MNSEELGDKIKELDELLSLIKRVILEDRRECKEFYDTLKEKWEEDEIISEMASAEKEINNALANMIKASDKVPKILEAISKILTALIKERALIAISQPQLEKEINVDDPMERLKLLPNHNDNDSKFLDNKQKHSTQKIKNLSNKTDKFMTDN